MHPASQTALGGCCISGINAGRCVNYTARDGAGKKQGGREIYRLICLCASSRRQRYVGSITTDEGYNGRDAAIGNHRQNKHGWLRCNHRLMVK